MSIYWVLALHFFILSLISFGGASATLPEMHRVFVDTLHLMSNADFINLYALSQAAPGPNVLFVGLFGWQMAALPGALISLVAMCGPTILISVAVEIFGGRYYNSKHYTVFRRSLTPISIGFLMSISVLLVRTSIDYRTILLSLATVIILLKKNINPLFLIIAGGILGALHWV